VRLLAARALSAEELRSRLRRRGFSEEDASAALVSVSEQGYLDDRALAYTMVASRAKRLLGRPRIAAELKRRGIEAGIVEEALRQTFADLDEDDLAGRAAAKLLPGGRAPRDEREKGRIIRALARRGFSTGSILRALARAGAAAGNRAVENGPERDPHAWEADDEPGGAILRRPREERAEPGQKENREDHDDRYENEDFQADP